MTVILEIIDNYFSRRSELWKYGCLVLIVLLAIVFVVLTIWLNLKDATP